MKKFFTSVVFRIRGFLLLRKMRRELRQKVNLQNPTANDLEIARSYLNEASLVLINALESTLTDYASWTAKLMRAPGIGPKELSMFLNLMRQNRQNLAGMSKEQLIVLGSGEAIDRALERYNEIINKLEGRIELMRSRQG
ncbi:MAG: hypothetical protein V4438_01345 [Patescibacteria group bacterium]